MGNALCISLASGAPQKQKQERRISRGPFRLRRRQKSAFRPDPPAATSRQQAVGPFSEHLLVDDLAADDDVSVGNNVPAANGTPAGNDSPVGNHISANNVIAPVDNGLLAANKRLLADLANLALVAGMGRMSLAEDAKLACVEHITALFPDICPNYLAATAEELGYGLEQVAAHILDKNESGQPYPKRLRATLKRKREEGDETAAQRFTNEERRQQPPILEYAKFARKMISQIFPRVPVKTLYAALEENNNRLFPAALQIEAVLEGSGKSDKLPFELKKSYKKRGAELQFDRLDETIRKASSAVEKEVLKEFQAVMLELKARRDAKDQATRHEVEEAENVEVARREGTLHECECCYTECPLNRMVHCNGANFHVGPGQPGRVFQFCVLTWQLSAV